MNEADLGTTLKTIQAACQSIVFTQQQLLQAIDRLNSSQVPLGFCEPPKRRLVCINRQPTYFWYSLSDNGKHIPYMESAISGIIRGIEVRPHKSKESVENLLALRDEKVIKQLKAYVHLDCDQETTLRMGFWSVTFRQFLLSIKNTTDLQLRNPICFCLVPGTEWETVSFCKLYDARKRQIDRAEFPENHTRTQYYSLFNEVALRLSTIHGQVETDFEDTDESEIDGATSQPLSQSEKAVDLSDVISQTSIEMQRTGFTRTQGRDYLQRQFGKESRSQLDEAELRRFLGYLKALPDRTVELQPEQPEPVK